MIILNIAQEEVLNKNINCKICLIPLKHSEVWIWKGFDELLCEDCADLLFMWAWHLKGLILNN